MQDRALPKNPLIAPDELKALHEEAWNWARFLVNGDRDCADEVMQMVYVQIVEGKARFRGKSTLKTWIYSVIRNTSRRYLRREHRWRLIRAGAPEAAKPEMEGACNGAGFDGDLPSESVRRHVSAAMAKLPARQREVLALVVYREFTLEQCAQVLGVRIGSARTHYQRAKNNLKQQLESVLLQDMRP